MKKLNFETSKGKFVVVDMPENKGKAIATALLCNSNFGEKEFKDSTYLGYISELTEQQASEIVDSEYNKSKYGQYEPTAIHRLKSLITSKGYYLFENPYKHPDNINIQPASLGWWKDQEEKYLEAQEKTFFNPIIFKLL